ncbi:MAG: MFS transporter [Oligoflexia bacterium]|nr:MFS transporter [Oligoflexia bacterium]
MSAEKNSPALPNSIWALGFVSLLMDVSSETVHGLLPVFLISTLGASFTTVGLIEGLGEGTALALKVFSGPLSDWWGKRKPLVLLGYGMGALSKPLFALAPSAGWILSARLFDRTGKGIRGAPRDALLADLAPPTLRGAAFGLRQSLDTVGAFLGPLLAIALMSLTGGNTRLVFWLAAIPGLLAVLLLFVGVQEPRTRQTPRPTKELLGAWRSFTASFWLVAAGGAVFQLARFSEAFLILKAKDLGLPLALAPAVLIAMNLVFALAAYPIGWLSDRVRRDALLLSGFALLAVSDAVLAFAGSLPLTFLGIALWGLHLGFTQGTLAALVADHCPADLRGTAYGVFNLLSAAAILLASPLAGLLWDGYGPKATFLVSCTLALTAFLGFVLFLRFMPRGPARAG